MKQEGGDEGAKREGTGRHKSREEGSRSWAARRVAAFCSQYARLVLYGPHPYPYTLHLLRLHIFCIPATIWRRGERWKVLLQYRLKDK